VEEIERRLDDWLDSYMIYTENSEPPILYRKWSAISVLAACLQRKCRLDWGVIRCYPNFYIILVGESGKCRKGTALGPAESLLRDTGVRLAAEATTREALIVDLEAAGWNEGSDGLKSPGLHSSLTIFSNELTVFLGWDNRQLMIDMVDWYDCKDEWKYKTKHHGDNKVVGVWVNLIGGTTPSLIRSALPHDAVGGGLTGRMIFVYEDRKAKTVIFPSLSEEAERIEPDLKADLVAISTMSGQFKLSEDFFDLWAEWYPKQDESPPFEDDRFGGYFERRPVHLLKLSMIMSASRSNSMVLEPIDFQKSLLLLKQTEVKMPRTFTGFGESRTAAVTERVMAFIAARGTTTFEELTRTFYRDADRDTLSSIIRTLGSMKFCKHDATQGVIKYLEEKKEEDK